MYKMSKGSSGRCTRRGQRLGLGGRCGFRAGSRCKNAAMGALKQIVDPLSDNGKMVNSGLGLHDRL